MKYTIDLHIDAARTLGFKVTLKTLASDKTEMDMIRQVKMLNKNPEIDAIVLLQPVPKQVSALKIMQSIDPDKEIE